MEKTGITSSHPSTPPPPLLAGAKISPLPSPFKPDLFERAWCSVPHPTLPLLATTHNKTATVFSLSSLTPHSYLTGGHARSVRSVAWKPCLNPGDLCLITGSFDSTAGIWRWKGESLSAGAETEPEAVRERDFTATGVVARDNQRSRGDNDDDYNDDGSNNDDKDWEFTLVLDGHDSELKSATFSPSGTYLATCSRDKSVWIWEDVGASERDDEWETVAVLNEHDGDVKAVAWCPDVPGRNFARGASGQRRFGVDVLASASYDHTVRIWREDFDGDWVCVAVLEGHDKTVWGVEWEKKPRAGDKFPRLLTHSADRTIKIWELKEDEDEAAAEGEGARGTLGAIPNTMRRSLREEWKCTTVMPAVHSLDVYSVSWSAISGFVASAGGDGVVALYGESVKSTDVQIIGGDNSEWGLLARVDAAHGPYEINHIVWCRRFDPGCENKGVEEMLVTTGDDGLIRPWKVEVLAGLR